MTRPLPPGGVTVRVPEVPPGYAPDDSKVAVLFDRLSYIGMWVFTTGLLVLLLLLVLRLYCDRFDWESPVARAAARRRRKAEQLVTPVQQRKQQAWDQARAALSHPDDLAWLDRQIDLNKKEP